MFSSLRGFFGRWLRRLWWALDFSRRAVLNLLILAFVVGGLVFWATSGPARLQENTALVLNLKGALVEQFSGGLRDSLMSQAQGRDDAQVRLRDVLAVLDAAAKDDKITRVVLDLDGLSSAGLPMLREVAAALTRFKASGKPVIATGIEFTQRNYYLAAQANEVWLHPMGVVYFEGYGRVRNYYRAAFDKLGVMPNVLRVGKFKSYGETFSETGPSPEATEAEKLLFDALWADFSTAVETARKQPAGAVKAYVDQMPEKLAAAAGDPAQLALQSKWVDALKTPDEVRALLIERGALDEKTKSYRQVSFSEYAARLKPSTDGDAVGVIVAEGNIVDGEAGPGTVGGVSTAALVKKAREDDKVKAIVLRVNSPGGSAFASELVRRELELTRKAGKPVVVSMGNLAASGGYWISMAADEVIADPATVTGSIGVVALLPTAKAAMDKIGVNTDGYTTTWLAKAYDPRRGLDPRLAQMVQSGIDHAYLEFTRKAAAARKTTREKIDDVGQGRVWSGTQAQQRGLVDRTGSFGDAIAAARERAKLPADARVSYIERDKSRLAQWADAMSAQAAMHLGAHIDLSAALAALTPVPAAATEALQQDLAFVANVASRRKPFEALVHCLCEVPE
jgi:protease-4